MKTKDIAIKAASFAIIGLIAVSIFAVVQYRRVLRMRDIISQNYSKSFAEISSYMTNIDYDLQKTAYATSSDQFTSLASKIWRESGNAKVCLESLPLFNENLQRTSAFLSQVGEYCMSLAKKYQNGEQLTQEEKDTLQKLSGYATKLTKSLNEMQNNLTDGTISSSQLYELMNDKQNSSSVKTAIADSFTKSEGEIADYPELIYDGPFSDYTNEKPALFLEKKEEISKEEALKKAAKYLSMSEGALKFQSEVKGNIKAFTFSFEGGEISITKKGGYLYKFEKSRIPDEKKIDMKDALAKGKKYLADCGYENMENSYYIVSDGTVTINYFNQENDVMIYTQLIKVVVALDNKEILAVEASGYLANGSEERDITTSVSKEEAQKEVSDSLTIEKVNLVVIPSDGGYDLLCYEFMGKDDKGQTIITYVNAKTGKQAKILILLETENGTLTM